MVIKKISAVILIFTALLSFASTAAETAAPLAEENLRPTDYVIPEDPDMNVKSRYAMLYSEYDDRVLFSKNADILLEPASTAKVMVGILVLEKYKDRLDEQVTVTSKLLEGKEGLSLYIEEGEVLTLRQLLTILLMHGANDVSTILAHYYMQDEQTASFEDELEAFCRLMTERAKALGCEKTVYKNVTGLHAAGATTILSDIIIIAKHAASLPGFTEMTSTDRLVIEKSGKTVGRVVLSRNHLVSSFQTVKYKTKGVIGMNYGSTDEMGECLLVCAEYDGKRYFIIIMGGYTDAQSLEQVEYTDAINLLEYAREGFTYIDVLKKGVIVTQTNVKFSTATDVVTLAPSAGVTMYLPVNTDVKEAVTYKNIVYETELEAPVAEGVKAGEIIVLYYGDEVCRVPLVTVTSVSESRILHTLDRVEKFVKQPVFIASVISFIVFLIIYVIIKSVIISGRKKRKKRIR